jgi:hypothetical protein
MSAGDVDDGADHALRDEAAAVADHAHGLAVAREQRVRGVAHVAARGGLVASTRRLVAASSISMSMPTVRVASRRSTAATVVTSKPSGATRISDCAAQARGAAVDLRAQRVHQAQQLGAARGAGRHPDRAACLRPRGRGSGVCCITPSV